MAVTKREDRKFKFETLQLHVGQEQPDPATDARAVPANNFFFINLNSFLFLYYGTV